ncbi:MAG: hypothetical protein RJA11_905 [Bacteroidota bacterium]
MLECLNNMHPLGSARGTLGSARGALGFAQTVRRAKPRREIQCIYTHPLGSARGALGFARGATLGFARGATLGSARGALGSARGALGSAWGATPRLRSGCNLKEIPIVLRNVVFTPISLHILPHVCI